MSDWQETSLAELADYINGRAIKSEECSKDQGIPIIRIKQINDPQSIEDRFCGDDLDDKNIVRSGDLLFSWSATLKTILWQGPTGAINQHIFKVLPRDGIDKIFLYYLIDHSIPALSEESHGSTMKHIKKSALSAFHLQIPPLPEQKRIAEILSGIDKFIVNLDNKIQKLLNLQEGMKNDLLIRGYGNKDFRESEIGMIPKSWEVKCLRDICEKITDRDHTTPKYVNANNGIPIISPTNINSDMELDLSKLKYISKEAHLKNQKKTDLMPDDIIFSRIGAALGKSYLIKKSFYDFSILHSICQIRVKRNFVYPNYLLWQMRRSLFQKSLWLGVQSIGVPDLGLGEIGKLKIPVCSLREQKVITNYLDKMHLQILQIRKKLTQTKSFKKSIMQELLTGKVRVQVN